MVYSGLNLHALYFFRYAKFCRSIAFLGCHQTSKLALFYRRFLLTNLSAGGKMLTELYGLLNAMSLRGPQLYTTDVKFIFVKAKQWWLRQNPRRLFFTDYREFGLTKKYVFLLTTDLGKKCNINCLLTHWKWKKKTWEFSKLLF